MPNKIQHHWRLGMKHVGHAARFGHRHYNYAKATLGNATNMVTSVATAANAIVYIITKIKIRYNIKNVEQEGNVLKERTS